MTIIFTDLLLKLGRVRALGKAEPDSPIVIRTFDGRTFELDHIGYEPTAPDGPQVNIWIREVTK